jgi:hypothetical protein
MLPFERPEGSTPSLTRFRSGVDGVRPELPAREVDVRATCTEMSHPKARFFETIRARRDYNGTRRRGSR